MMQSKALAHILTTFLPCNLFLSFLLLDTDFGFGSFDLDKISSLHGFKK